MKINWFNFLKGILIGMIFLPIELSLLSLTTRPVKAQEDIRDDVRDIIRSQVNDAREIREEYCEEGSCSRPTPPRPSHRPTTSPEPSPTPQVSPSPTPQPSPSPDPGVGGNDNNDDNGGDNGDSGGEEKKEAGTPETKTLGPQVLGLSFTGSGLW